MTDMADKAYERGVENGTFRGKTEATVAGLAKTLDSIADRLDCLPCQERGKTLARLKVQVGFQWATITFMLAVLGYLVFGK